MIISKFNAVVSSTIGFIAFFSTTLIVSPLLWLILCYNSDTIFYSSTREASLKELAIIQQWDDNLSRREKLLAWYVNAEKDGYTVSTNLAIAFIGLVGGIGSGLVSLFGVGIIFSVIDTKIRTNQNKINKAYYDSGCDTC